MENISGHLWQRTFLDRLYYAYLQDRRSALPSRNHIRISRLEQRGGYGSHSIPPTRVCPRSNRLPAAWKHARSSCMYDESSHGSGHVTPVKPVVHLCKDELKVHIHTYTISVVPGASFWWHNRSDSQYHLYMRSQRLYVAGSTPTRCIPKSWTLQALVNWRSSADSKIRCLPQADRSSHISSNARKRRLSA
jgi:hypothetical protein